MTLLQLFLVLQTATFVGAALVHAGVLADGYQHPQAMIAETVIAVVLFASLLAGMTSSRWRRPSALGAQAFALVGTLVGAVMMAIGVGPQSAFDVGLHTAMVALLVAGLAVAWREPRVVRTV